MEETTNSVSTTITQSRSLLYDPDAGSGVDQYPGGSAELSMSEELMMIEISRLQPFEDLPYDIDQEEQAGISGSKALHSSPYEASSYHHSDKSPSRLSAKSAEIIDRQRCIDNPSGAKSTNGSTYHSHRSAPSPSAGQMLSATDVATDHLSHCSDDNEKKAVTEEMCVSTNDTGCSRFDGDRHCRYCYSEVSAEHNSSACLCSGLLCRDCLQRELLISWNRELSHNQWDRQNRQINQLVPSLKCTVCKFQYPVSRSKLEIETSWMQYIYYLYKKTFPKKAERDRSVLEGVSPFNSLNLLPVDVAQGILSFLWIWIAFTVLLEGFGPYTVSDGRVSCFIFDSYLMVKVMRLTYLFDFPERIWILLPYLLRSFLFLAFAVKGKLAEQALQASSQMESDAADLNPDNLDHYNWKWLAALILFSWAMCAYEYRQYHGAILRRALRDDTGQIRVTITSKSGSDYPFTLPNPIVNANFAQVNHDRRDMDSIIMALGIVGS